jgi:hypothetical protein
MPSTIFVSDEKDMSSKLTKFIILLGEFRLDDALRMVPEFSNQSYSGHLDRLLQHLDLAANLQKEVSRYRAITMHLKEEVTRLNDKLIQQNVKLLPSSMSQQQKHIIEVNSFIEANQLKKGLELAKIYKMSHIATIIQELEEYHWLK